MGGSSSKSKSDSSNQNQFNQNVFNPQAGNLSDLYASAGNLFNQNLGGYNQQFQQGLDTTANAADMATQGAQDQLSGGAYGDLGVGQDLMSSLNQSLGSPSAMQDINAMIMGGSGNNYADAMKNTYMQDANLAQKQMLGNLDSRAAASGMSGGARQGIATAQGMQDINKNLQQNLAQTGFGAFDKDLDRKLQIAQQADQGTFNRQQLMSNMLGNQNKSMQFGTNATNNLFKQGNQMQNAGFGGLSQYANIIGSPTVLGSGSGAGNASSKGLSGSGGIGGGKGK